MKVLVTGFDPFGGETINPAYEAVKNLDNNIDGANIVKVEIPTVFNKSIEKLKQAIEREKPEIVLCVGQAGGRFKLTVERVAINIDDARIADNEDKKPIDKPIFRDGKNAYFSNLPIKAMVKKIVDNDLPASISNSAGTFVCNHLLYGLLYLIDKKYPEIRGGFMHVPYIPEQVTDKKSTPSMSLNNISSGIKYAIKAAINNREDIKIGGGKII